MSGTQAADDDVDRIGKLQTKLSVAACPQQVQRRKRQHDAREDGDRQCFHEIAPKRPIGHEHDSDADAGDHRELPQPDRHARLQHQAVERQQRRPVKPAPGQAALSAQLHQNALAVRLTLHQLKPPVDAGAI